MWKDVLLREWNVEGGKWTREQEPEASRLSRQVSECSRLALVRLDPCTTIRAFLSAGRACRGARRGRSCSRSLLRFWGQRGRCGRPTPTLASEGCSAADTRRRAPSRASTPEGARRGRP